MRKKMNGILAMIRGKLKDFGLLKGAAPTVLLRELRQTAPEADPRNLLTGLPVSE